MNTNLEKVFNLAPIPNDIPKDNSSPIKVDKIVSDIVELDKIDAALTQVTGLDSSDSELDDIAATAMQSYEKLMELGYNVEMRFAADIFSAASGLLGHALTAKQNKVERRLKQIDLQLKKMKLDQNKPQNSEPAPEKGALLDRNELLQQLLQKNNK